ncbi:hypothetical protein FHX82_002312 [Amycolatopsis bartoniae]|uniref:hypothetical protein n=1 Tax=Amycolatopsis bartoniae TaxID=941986 RepID=UPI0011976615|nr:hypothetical protein [Amycolatopsis bartoniae]MBB2935292.1 hypothetical protein [Amycolatopsis bartoniae]TVT06805.1 hypothetical protein FNH07_18725 [Amycolatopsis bartoniae]
MAGIVTGSTACEATPVKVRGGTSIPFSFGYLNLSWPMGVLVTNHLGVGIRVEPVWIQTLLSRSVVGPARLWPGYLWLTTWQDLVTVEHSLRSVYLHSASNYRGARFVTLVPDSIDPFLAEVRRRGVAVSKTVSTTNRLRDT